MTEPALSNASPAPEEDVTTTLYRAAIGPVSTGYYLPIFTRFEAADHAGISWNTAASLLTLNWLVFRKLWIAALAYVGILVAVALLVFGVGHLVLQFSDTLMMVLGLGFGLVAFVLPGLFGNALFHTECRKAMSKALVGHANVADARDALLHQASTRRRAIWLTAANAALLLVAVMVYLQVAALSTLSVMPQGALEAGQVAVGRAVDVPTTAINSASMPVAAASAAAPIASAPLVTPSAPAMTASAPVAVASAALPTASEPKAAASVASAPAASASAPLTRSSAAAEQPIKAIQVASASSREAKPAALHTVDTETASPVVQAKAKPKKEVEKAAKNKKLQAALTAPKPVEASAPAPSTSDTATKAFFINVGLFGVPENAAKAHAKLLEAQLPSVMKELKSKTRQIRVRVGPFATQAAAEAAVEKIKALQLDAAIIQL
jgi:cell division protein FtsN